IILEEILEDLDEDGREINIDDVARAAMFPDHPLGYKITGPYENVERFGLADVQRHFLRGYGARNMVLTVSGAVEHARVHELAGDELGRACCVAGGIDGFADAALCEVGGSCGHANVLPLLRESLAVLARLRDEPPSDEELAKAKRRFRWDLQSTFDDPDAMAG